MKLEIYEDTWKMMVSRNPDFKGFYPRRIAYPHGYLNPCYYAMSMLGAGLQYRARLEINSETTHAITVVCNEVLKYQMPVYFLDRQFLLAMDASRLPESLTFIDVHWPMPALVFAFPVDWMQERFGWPIGFAGCAKLPGGAVAPHPMIRLAAQSDMNMGLTGPMCLFHFPYYCQDGNPVDYCSRYPQSTPLGHVDADFDKWEDSVENERLVYNTIKPGLGDELVTRDPSVPMPSHEQEVKLLNELTILTTKVILTMGVRSTLVSTGGMARKAKVKNGITVKDELWNPNFVGYGYKLKTGISEPGDGTHASPRMHWRRGHWHLVVHGKGRALRRNEWFEPTLVNPPK